MPGRSCADDHYAQSRWEDRLRGGDSRVIALLDAYEAALAARTAAPAEQGVEGFEPISRDEDHQRDYIPIGAGWEIQTKGKGSTFRISDASGDRRLPIPPSPYLHETLTVMAREVHAYWTARLAPIAPDARGVERMAQAFPMLSAFYDKHALGPKSAPSCLCCGKLTTSDRVAVQHLELPGIVVCADCRPLARSVDGLSGEEMELLGFVEVAMHKALSDLPNNPMPPDILRLCAIARRLAGAKVPGGGE